ncbi:MAG: hypothetical protein JNK16_06520 [Phycisphaerales bacterium]|nr:hypothetical protein [Phycisphaerales bacterium]
MRSRSFGFPALTQGSSTTCSSFSSTRQDDIHDTADGAQVSKYAKRTPDGNPDQSMFTTDQQAVGIQVGTAIATLVKNESRRTGAFAKCHYRELWGTANRKRELLVQSLTQAISKTYRVVEPVAAQRFAFAEPSAEPNYLKWPSLDAVFSDFVSGIVSRRDEFVVDIDRGALVERIKRYLDKSVSDADIAAEFPRVMEDGSGFDAVPARRELLARGYDESRILPIYFRPLDVRWIYYEPAAGLVSAPSPRFRKYLPAMTLALEMRQKLPTLQWDRGFVASTLADSFGNGCSVYFTDTILTESLSGDVPEPNISIDLLSRLADSYGFKEHSPKSGALTREAESVARSVFLHTLAILWSPTYRKANEAALRQDWPRVPIPADPKRLEGSAVLGRQLADLLLPDKAVTGVTTGKLRPELKSLAVPYKIGGKPIDPDKDLEVTATWGFRGQGNAVMSGKGKVTPNDIDPANAVDIWINDAVGWRNVPKAVYEMTIGGYPVVKKWLSYREKRVLGRALKMEEMIYVTEMVRRLAAVLALSSELDANYAACAKDAITLK